MMVPLSQSGALMHRGPRREDGYGVSVRMVVPAARLLEVRGQIICSDGPIIGEPMTYVPMLIFSSLVPNTLRHKIPTLVTQQGIKRFLETTLFPPFGRMQSSNVCFQIDAELALY